MRKMEFHFAQRCLTFLRKSRVLGLQIPAFHARRELRRRPSGHRKWRNRLLANPKHGRSKDLSGAGASLRLGSRLPNHRPAVNVRSWDGEKWRSRGIGDWLCSFGGWEGAGIDSDVWWGMVRMILGKWVIQFNGFQLVRRQNIRKIAGINMN